MNFTKFIGRILLAILFVSAGISFLQNPDPQISYANVRYPVFYAQIAKHTNNALEGIQQLNPNEFIKHTPCMIKTLGWAQVLLGFGVGIGCQGAGCLLALFTIIITGFSHNPYFYGKEVDFQHELLQIVFNVGIMGALFMVGGKKKQKKVEPVVVDAKVKKVEVAPEEKKEIKKGGKKGGKY